MESINEAETATDRSALQDLAPAEVYRVLHSRPQGLYAAEAVPFIVFLFSRGTIPLPLTIMQVLAIDLGTDMMPAIGLGAEPPESGLMQRPPPS